GLAQGALPRTAQLAAGALDKAARQLHQDEIETGLVIGLVVFRQAADIDVPGREVVRARVTARDDAATVASLQGYARDKPALGRRHGDLARLQARTLAIELDVATRQRLVGAELVRRAAERIDETWRSVRGEGSLGCRHGESPRRITMMPPDSYQILAKAGGRRIARRLQHHVGPVPAIAHSPMARRAGSG